MPRVVSACFSIALISVSLLSASTLAQVPSVQDREQGFVVANGRATFRTFCSSCHGLEGHGDGPIAEHLKIPPSDVTQIQLRFGGTFPERWIHEVIDGRTQVRAHGDEEMPVWGNVFQSPVVDGGGRPVEQGPNLATRKIREVVVFLRSIQQIEDEESDGETSSEGAE